MTTILNPNGTPIPAYNREGRTIETATATGSFSFATALQLIGHAQTTVVLVTQGASNGAGVIMPSGAEIGDVFEVYGQPSQSGNVLFYAPSGETIDGVASSSFNLNPVKAFVLRKVSSTDWRITSQP